MKQKDLSGIRFGRLLAVSRVGTTTYGKPIWLCKCDCGKSVEVVSANLRSGNSQSCGCLKSALTADRKFIHGRNGGDPTYGTWVAMKARCLRERSSAFHKYGAKGVAICERWMFFVNFLEDMGERPDGMTIDRIDGSGNYEPGNCRWATPAQQRANQKTPSNAVRVFAFGCQLILSDAAKQAGLPCRLVYRRIFELGWTADNALTEPTTGRLAA